MEFASADEAKLAVQAVHESPVYVKLFQCRFYPFFRRCSARNDRFFQFVQSRIFIDLVMIAFVGVSIALKEGGSHLKL
jgi:hypothetical protein